MAVQSSRSTRSRRNSNQFSGVRLALATGALISVLIGAQAFASSASAGTTSANAPESAVFSSASSGSGLALISNSSSSQSFSNNSRGSVFSTQIQPRPRGHSSR